VDGEKLYKVDTCDPLFSVHTSGFLAFCGAYDAYIQPGILFDVFDKNEVPEKRVAQLN
jgi:hypothetical protein